MFIEERIKLGIDISIVYFGVLFFSNFISQAVIIVVNHKNILSNAVNLNIFVIYRIAFMIGLVFASLWLHNKFKLKMSDTVYTISGVLLILASINVMAVTIYSAIISINQLNQTVGSKKEMLMSLANNNFIGAIDNIVNMFVGIGLITFGEKRIKK